MKCVVGLEQRQVVVLLPGIRYSGAPAIGLGKVLESVVRVVKSHVGETRRIRERVVG